MSHRRVQKESDELSYTVRSLVMVRNQLPAQVVNRCHWALEMMIIYTLGYLILKLFLFDISFERKLQRKIFNYSI